MRLKATAARASASQNGHHPPDSDISVSHATRYLCAAAYLRRSMLPDEIIEPGRPAARAPLPVGRRYARRVLFHAGGVVPGPAVDNRAVRKHCWVGLFQTIIRDAAVTGVLITSAVIQPWAITITFGLLIAAVLLVGRVRLSSPLTIAVVIVAALALLKGGRHPIQSLGVPVICLAACFVIYMLDVLWSAHRVRNLWREFLPQQRPQSPTSTPTPEPVVTPEYQWPPGVSADGHGRGKADLNGHGGSRKIPTPSNPSRAYYDKYGIVGAGTSLQALTLTVPLDKPLHDDIQIEVFSATELLDYVSNHLMSQGVREASVHGYAYGSPTKQNDEPGTHEPQNFTYGLPYLDVGKLVAIPLPKAQKRPLRRGSFLSLDYVNRPPEKDVRKITDRSPSEHPERHYVRASTSSWDGQLVVSIYVNTALQGHFLRVITRPYVLAPIVSDLKIADELATRHPFVVLCLALRMTVRHHLLIAKKIHRLGIKTPTSKVVRRKDLYSTREYYSQPEIDNIHQREDSDRIIDILERKIIGVTMDYLRKKNIDIEEYEQRILNQTNIIGDGNITGTITGSQVNTVTGQGNTATNTSNGKK